MHRPLSRSMCQVTPVLYPRSTSEISVSTDLMMLREGRTSTRDVGAGLLSRLMWVSDLDFKRDWSERWMAVIRSVDVRHECWTSQLASSDHSFIRGDLFEILSRCLGNTTRNGDRMQDSARERVMVFDDVSVVAGIGWLTKSKDVTDSAINIPILLSLTSFESVQSVSHKPFDVCDGRPYEQSIEEAPEDCETNSEIVFAGSARPKSCLTHAERVRLTSCILCDQNTFPGSFCTSLGLSLAPDYHQPSEIRHIWLFRFLRSNVSFMTLPGSSISSESTTTYPNHEPLLCKGVALLRYEDDVKHPAKEEMDKNGQQMGYMTERQFMLGCETLRDTQLHSQVFLHRSAYVLSKSRISVSHSPVLTI
ncbi:hypothetical protein SISNIDRAFT_469651 [Sistotremastrum niveocremeum HHB9708]|uniref:Uncharacterized protein n=1 Tax=Sistotremastrum niveocremeum HHB9708 TaxID=1314777 RepID=A0A164PQI5_9AGAM|nr:hypothetical protein SISNIDRAFT_469651 [Sistotremastrum niveocremeum HHB9708]